MESLNEEVKFTPYTVFSDDGGTASNCPEGCCAGFSLERLIAWHVEHWGAVVAWSPLYAHKIGKDLDELRATAIREGRLIEKQADGSFIPRGVGGEALFRVGGIYKQQDGNLRRLAAVEPADFALASASARSAYADTVPVVARFVDRPGATWGDGWRRLSDGKYHGTTRGSDLIPGELNEQGEPISCGSPIAATPPTTEPSPSEARENERGGLTIAQWKAIQAAKPEAIAAAKDKAEREAIKTRGCAGNPHPHWGAAVGLVK